jgi:FkbM family methyltransferase
VQFFNSLYQMMQSEGVNPAVAICRHLSWQARRAMGKFPCELRLSQSILLAEEPTGVAALVNAMGMYDFNNMSLLRAALEREVATFVDVGANIGPYTLIASEHQKTFVVSIEPHPETFIKLARNVERNGRKNVACLNLAISDHDGHTLLSDGRYSSLNRVIDPARADQKCLSVPCQALDSLCAELNIRPDVIKIDVEGHESQVIQGFREHLGSVSLVMIEGGEKDEIRSAMRKEGLLGPFYFHRSEDAFLRTPQPRAEDPVYLSAAFLKERGAFNAGLANEKLV